MFPELSLCVNGQESEYPFNVNAYESEYSKIDESGNIYESGKISSSVNLVLMEESCKLGGPGKTVQIDESKIGKRKYHRGHHVEGQWVFGGSEEGSRRCFIVPVKTRSCRS